MAPERQVYYCENTIRLSMRAYQVTIPGYKAFTIITDEPPENIPAAIFERFGVEPVSVVAL